MDEKKNRRSLLSAFFMFFALIIAIAGIVACIALFVLPQNIKSENSADNELTEEAFSKVTQEQLDSPDVTIEEVVFFEKSYNETHSAESRDQKILDRIFALKHILLGALMSETHNREGFINICTIHAGGFSPQQQEIIDWYLGLNEAQQEQWEKCQRVTNLSEFKDAVKKQNNIK